MIKIYLTKINFLKKNFLKRTKEFKKITKMHKIPAKNLKK